MVLWIAAGTQADRRGAPWVKRGRQRGPGPAGEHSAL